MSPVSFADVVHQSISFSPDDPGESLILSLIDTPWVQRLRDVHQTANTRLVYMFSEHSRFGHSLGVAYMACRLMDKLAHEFPEDVAAHRPAIAAAALLHDVGHLAPGSHIASKVWFPNQPDTHEQTAVRIVLEDPIVRGILERQDPQLPQKVAAILTEDPQIDPWTWQIISGGGWNVDRGNWCIVDSIFAGVSYGHYNIPALTDSIVITKDKQLALRENRLDAMMHFAVSRQAMYRQVYQHRVLLAADTLQMSVAQRARDLGPALSFADTAMRQTLAAASAADISLSSIFSMREAWWRYHLDCWRKDPDPILADLADRVLNRRLLKTVRLRAEDNRDALLKEAQEAVTKAGFDPKYYLKLVNTFDVNASDSHQAMAVLRDDGKLQSLQTADPLINFMMKESKDTIKTWIALPEEAKRLMQRER